MVSFNKAPYLGKEEQYIRQAIQSGKLCGDGPYTKRCHTLLEHMTQTRKALLTTSCTHALEMAALLADIGPGDEVIMPSYTFVSTADAFILRGATAVFVDIRPDTMNMDETKVEAAITPRTKAIVPVHYAGVGCEMDVILKLAKQYHLYIIEDAAQGICSAFHGKPLGTIGNFGCYSFHETKNISMGEGGALLLREEKDIARAEVIREKGTDRSRFFRGEIAKYTWVDAGSSYLPSELNAAYLYAQLEAAEKIMEDRMHTWQIYQDSLRDLETKGRIALPQIPDGVKHNAHMFYIKAEDLEERKRLLIFLKERGIGAVFHYIPLHSSVAGRKYGRFSGRDVYTTKESERLVRLPLYYGMREEVYEVVERVREFYQK